MLAVFCTTAAKGTDATEIVVATTPVPETGMERTLLLFVVSVTVSTAGRAPSAEGVNRTATVQVAPTARFVQAAAGVAA
jgi:hypothetical protein